MIILPLLTFGITIWLLAAFKVNKEENFGQPMLIYFERDEEWSRHLQNLWKRLIMAICVVYYHYFFLHFNFAALQIVIVKILSKSTLLLVIGHNS